MSASLYDKMQDSQDGVVGAIVDGMADQQFMQMLLAYMLLLLKDRPVKVRAACVRLCVCVGGALARLFEASVGNRHNTTTRPHNHANHPPTHTHHHRHHHNRHHQQQ